MKKMFFLTLTVLTAACVFFTACSGEKSSGTTFTIALDEDIEAVDPGKAWDYVTNQVTNQITEGLVTFDEKYNIIPALADSWSQIDELTYVYNVRDNVVFSDGTKMTMDDVLFSFERTKNHDGGTYFSDYLSDIESFSVDGWQFTIKLSQPSAIFKYIPATGAGRIISKTYYEKNEKDFGTASGGIVATGPYKFQSWTSGQEIVLKKNTNYWNKEKLEANIIDTIVFKIIPDGTTRIMALQTGEVDFCVNLPTDQLDYIATLENVTLTSVDSAHLTYLALNTERAPMNDVNVRRAISRALDIPYFQKNIIGRIGSAGTILPFGKVLYGDNASEWEKYLSDNQGYTFDLAAARRHLAASRYPNGFNCDIVVNENFLPNQRALFIQAALKEININVNIRKMSGGEQDRHQKGKARDTNGKRDYDMIIGGWETDYPDINGNIGVMYSSAQEAGGYNAAGYINPAVDVLIAAQRSTIDPQKRFDIHKNLMDIIVRDVPYIVFDYTYRFSALNNKYTGLAISSSWLWVLPVQNVREN